MKKIINVFRVIRNNWKKSAFAAGLVSYGVNYGKNAYDTRQLMRQYCNEASKYGDAPSPLSQPLRRVTVILNPAAKKRKCADLYEKYCAPLLHLAGLSVTVVQTEYAGQAKDLPEILDPFTDALVIAGGDGTLAETVTGLFRRAEGNLRSLQNLPVAILPLGRTNTIANAIFGDLEEVRALASATMAVIDGSIRKVDVIKIEPLEDEGKPVYGLARIDWGAHRDVHAKRDKYWLVGPWREYLAYLMFGPAEETKWTCQYSDPCTGCLRCSPPEVTVKRWWHSFLPKQSTPSHLLVANEECGKMKDKMVNTASFSISTDTVNTYKQRSLLDGTSAPDAPHLKFEIGPKTLGRFELAYEGWSKIKGATPKTEEELPVRQLKLFPADENEEGKWFSIDNEDFELRPISITLLPKSLYMFQSRRGNVL